MGNWNISIEGIGAHHNKDNPQDANRMAQAFVGALKRAGHNVTKASFTYGAVEILRGDIEPQGVQVENVQA